jgi:GT2 family glycosyltransferase
VRDDCIQRAVRDLQEDCRAAAVYSPVKIPAEAPWWERVKNLWYYAHLPIGLHTIQKVRPGTISNISAFYRMDALAQVGLFDERMAGGGEDLRMGLDLHNAGWGLLVDPRCAVYHTHGIRSWAAMRAEKRYWSFVARQALNGGDVPFDRRKLWYRGHVSWLND